MNRRISLSPLHRVSTSPYQGSSLSLNAPAKINWFLQILGKREDGYHNIKTIMQCINLYDCLTFEHADSIDVACDLDIPVHDNIIYKTVSLLKKRVSYREGAKILLKKNIPVGAGLGGGSSDAAYTLLGLNMLWGLGLSSEELSSISAEIGADVPFFLKGPFSLVEGKGEKIKPLEIISSIILLIVKPRISVSTAWAYSRVDLFCNEKLTKNPIDIKLFCQALNMRDFTSLGMMLYNDFEDAVMSKYPVVREIKHRLSEMGAVISAMSGSGSAVFGVFLSKVEAARAAQAMKPNFSRVVETLTTASSKQ